MTVVNDLQLFTLQEHVNTLAAYDTTSVWAVLHNLGKVLLPRSLPDSCRQCHSWLWVLRQHPTQCKVQSQVVQVELSSGKVVKRLRDVGNNSHGLVSWQGRFVMLSSKETSLIIMNPEDGSVQYIWSVRALPSVPASKPGDVVRCLLVLLILCLVQAPQGFLKGLMVLDDTAYFGISPPMQRQDRDGPKVMCDLVAVDLNSQKQIFRRSLQTHGLLNVISAPHLSESSTYIAVSTGAPSTSGFRSTLPGLQAAGSAHKQVQQAQQLSSGISDAARWSRDWLQQALDEKAVDGEWPSSMPRLNMQLKQMALRDKRRAAALPDSPIYVHLGKAPPALIQPVQVPAKLSIIASNLRRVHA